MADPVSMMAVVGMVGSAAGAGVSAFGKLQEGQAAKDMYAYKAAVADINRKRFEQAGQIAAQTKGMEIASKEAITKATFGASNLTGESQDRVLQSMHDVGIQEQGTIMANARERAWGAEAEGELDIKAGEDASKASKIAAVGSILGGVSSVSDKWIAGRQAGVPFMLG